MPLPDMFATAAAWIAETYGVERRPRTLVITLDNGDYVRLVVPANVRPGSTVQGCTVADDASEWHLTGADESVMQFLRTARMPMLAREVRDGIEAAGIEVLSESCVQKSLRKLVVIGLVIKSRDPQGYVVASREERP